MSNSIFLLIFIKGNFRFCIVGDTRILNVTITFFAVFTTLFFFKTFIKINIILLGIQNFVIDVIRHHRTLKEKFNISQVLDNLDDIQLCMKSLLSFIYEMDNLFLVLPEPSTAPKAPKLVM